MVFQYHERHERYYRFWFRFLDLERKVRFILIDFKKPWWYIIWQQKSRFIWALLATTAVNVFYALLPLLFGYVLSFKSTPYFIALMSAYFMSAFGEFASLYYAFVLEAECIQSLEYNAFRFFLTVDPISHIDKQRGRLFAKIERCARAYEDLIDMFFIEFLPMVIALSTVVVSFFAINILFGMIALCCLSFIAFVNIRLMLFTAVAFEGNIIQAHDAVKASGMESLTQIQLIRSSFASNDVHVSVRDKNRTKMVREATSWVVSVLVGSFTQTMYVGSVCALGFAVLFATQHGSITVVLATSIIVTYVNNTYEIMRIGRRLQKMMIYMLRIKDFFSYVRAYGMQTFPVLAKRAMVSESKPRVADAYRIEVNNLTFHYPKQNVTLFENHSCVMTLPGGSASKLYGVIGPSGIGKTTLISILGGQLKPDAGSITINDLSIYDVDDVARASVLAVQGQVAASLSGNVRSNILIGIPPQAGYSDDDMREVLRKVGLWEFFMEKGGLDAEVGEGGLNVSGGQRQRLNFASLYLRAKYFKPALILIDEPTSSLDELSELAITSMIEELARTSVTLVIAHRLRTLQNAVGILDCSLLKYEKKMTFYPPSELGEHSNYYKQLVAGTASIEE